MTNYYKLNPSLLERYFRKDEEGYAMVEFSFYFSFHFLDGYRLEYRQRAAQVCQDYWSLFGHRMRWMTTPLKCLWRPVPEGFSMAQWLGAFPDKDWAWSMTFHSGRIQSEAANAQIVGVGNSIQTHSCSDLYLFVPLTEFAANPSLHPVALYRRWAQMLRARHGTAGYGMVPPEDTPRRAKTTALAEAFAKQCPGVELADEIGTTNALYGLLSPNWLNMIDSEYLKQLGGIEAIKAGLGQEALGATVGLHPYEGGLILSSGEVPLLYEGDEPKQPPLAYGPVARLLKPLRTPEAWGSWGCPKDDSLDWYARFD